MDRSTAFIPKRVATPRSNGVLPPPVLATTATGVVVVPAGMGQRVPWRGQVTAVVAAPAMLCLGAVTDEGGRYVWERVWLRHTAHLRSLDLTEGDMVAFVARVDRLLDGSYVLTRPLKVCRVGE